jgi:hypothetical protein
MVARIGQAAIAGQPPGIEGGVQRQAGKLDMHEDTAARMERLIGRQTGT